MALKNIVTLKSLNLYVTHAANLCTICSTLKYIDQGLVCYCVGNASSVLVISPKMILKPFKCSSFCPSVRAVSTVLKWVDVNETWHLAYACVRKHNI